ncbi:MAG: hypothetical protein OER43_11140 [Gammaproteobacteria bacterium]|nr:hypothetical protein [Gammaproteobacteria bacterium]MDH3414597.1 hypothetical protein [Gammaproteobacteria bacterium]
MSTARLRSDGLGQPDARLKPHPLYRALGRDDREGQAAYRALFGAHLDDAAIDDIRLALNQSQPVGNARFHATLEPMTGIRREAKPIIGAGFTFRPFHGAVHRPYPGTEEMAKRVNIEVKFTGPDGVTIDLSEHGWLGTKQE